MTAGSRGGAGEAPAVLQHEVLQFEEGIPGFPQSRRFALVDVAEDSAFQFLESLDEPDVGMVVTVPWLFFPDYELDLSDAELSDLEITEPSEAVVFCAVTLDAATETVYLNLLGPFVVNASTRRGRQLVLTDSEYPVRAPVKLVDA